MEMPTLQVRKVRGRWSNLPDHVTPRWESQDAFMYLWLANMSLLPLFCPYILVPSRFHFQILAYLVHASHGLGPRWRCQPSYLPNWASLSSPSSHTPPSLCTRDWENIPSGYVRAHPRRLKEEPSQGRKTPPWVISSSLSASQNTVPPSLGAPPLEFLPVEGSALGLRVTVSVWADSLTHAVTRGCPQLPVYDCFMSLGF